MQGQLIDVAAHRVASIQLPDEEPSLFEALRAIVGCKRLALGAVFPNGDVLYVNPLGALEVDAYFRHSLASAPMAGNAIVLGSSLATGEVQAVQSTLSLTRASVTFMDRMAMLEWAITMRDQHDVERAA